MYDLIYMAILWLSETANESSVSSRVGMVGLQPYFGESIVHVAESATSAKFSQALVDKMIHSYRLILEDTIIDEDATFNTYRIDLLLAVELCNWISKEFIADVAVLEIMGGATFAMPVEASCLIHNGVGKDYMYYHFK
ncbi:hypothetical protein N7478_010946 [Penicillium angulare]|uniref:uncharacterized protein n=1 Tax=Penicillium angulare TaxID=116970 RepID=UPI00253FE031|nr:uncharacterized protein N7478_010946 [Penicillium angulare]KAJ5263341.1 hypothetical protein N7478_010946 [Penicillium angulare]